MITPEKVIDQTKKWINDVVVGCNLCPFAANVVKQQRVHYQVETNSDPYTCMGSFLRELARLD